MIETLTKLIGYDVLGLVIKKFSFKSYHDIVIL